MDVRLVQVGGREHDALALADELLMFFAETYERVFGFPHPPLHDPCAVFFAVAPDKFRTEKMRVDVECAGALTAGTTVVDWWGQSPEKPRNVDVAVDMVGDQKTKNKPWVILLQRMVKGLV